MYSTSAPCGIEKDFDFATWDGFVKGTNTRLYVMQNVDPALHHTVTYSEPQVIENKIGTLDAFELFGGLGSINVHQQKFVPFIKTMRALVPK